MIARRERWCYAAGDLGFNFVWQSSELYLFFFYVRGLHLRPATASAIFLAGLVADWVADPLVGMLADRAAPAVPLRVWIVASGPLTVLMLVAAFTPPALPAPLLPGAALAVYLLLRISYSLGNVPYGALTSRLSDRAEDHLALTGARMQGAALGGIVAGLIYALLPAHGAVADFRGGALLLAALSLPAFMATGLGVTERVRPASPRPSTAGATMLGLLRRSSPLRWLLLVILAAGLTVTLVDKSLLFLFEALGMPRVGYLVAMVPSLSLLLSGGLWSRLGVRWGTMPVLVAAAALALVAEGGALVLPVAAVVLPLTCAAIVAGCGLSVMFWSMVPAAVAACETLAEGQGCAGRVYALASMARKLAGAMGPLLLTPALDTAARPLLAVTAASAALTALVAVAYRFSTPAMSAAHHSSLATRLEGIAP